MHPFKDFSISLLLTVLLNQADGDNGFGLSGFFLDRLSFLHFGSGMSQQL